MVRVSLVVLAVWLLLGVLFGIQVYLNSLPSPDPSQKVLAPVSRTLRLTDALGYAIRRYAIYAILTLPIVWLCRRFPIPSPKWLKSIAAHTIGFFGFSVAYTALRLLIYPPVQPGTFRRLAVTPELASNFFRSNLFDGFWMYCSIALVALVYQYQSELRKRELHASQMQRQMAEYELQILKLQLHPHFLFNTLNGISTLMTRDVRTARQMLLRLSELLRIALSHTSEKTISLREELEFVEAYLEIEQMRFGDRLKVEMDVSASTLDDPVPNMILQPLVENAIRHGVATERNGGKIEVRTSRIDGLLRITIGNDGPAINVKQQTGTRVGSGVGLGNTRARLWQLYGDTYQLRLSNRKQGGVEVCLELPLQVAAEATT
jgi:two-component sensor histidine kinase